MRTAYRYLSWLIFAAVIVQVGLAGYGAFNAANKAEDAHHDDAQTITLGKDTIEDGFGLHWAVGELILLLTLLALILAAVGGIRGRRLKLAGALFGLLVLQVILGFLGFATAYLGALHPINALLIVGLSGWLAISGKRDDSLEPVPVTPPAPTPAV